MGPLTCTLAPRRFRLATIRVVAQITNVEAVPETSQQRGQRLLEEYRAFRKAGVIPAEWLDASNDEGSAA